MMLHEISRRLIYVNKHEEPIFSWQNSVLSLVVSKHITFFDFTYDLKSTEKCLDLEENVVSVPSDSPVPTQILQNHLQKGMKNIELMEMITNPLFWPHSKELKKEMEGLKSLKCSPDNFINNSQCVTAVVNNFGNVNLLSPNRCTHRNQLNFTKTIIDARAPFRLNEAKNIEKIKDYTYKTATSAICWAPNLNEDKSCYFVTVQNSRELLVWSITCGKEIKSEFCGEFPINCEAEVENITWIPYDDAKILLVCSDLDGQVVMCECSVACNSFKLIKEHTVWQHKDKMVAKFVHFLKVGENMVLMFTKNRHLVAQMFDKQFYVTTQNILPVNDHKIVSFVNLQNEYIFLGTINSKIYKLNVKVTGNNLNISLDAINVKENLQSYELVGIGISQNKAIYALALKDKRLLHRKDNIKIDLAFFSSNNDSRYYLNELVENPSQSLSSFWDCIELMRCNSYKNKNIPEYDYNSLLVETNVYKLKVYHLILMFYTTLKKSKVVDIPSLPNTDVEELREKILVTQAVKLLNNLKVELHNNIQLDSFQWECFVGSRNFLQYFCNKYKKSVTTFIEQKILDIVCHESEYTCQSCDSKIKGFSCTADAGHFNMFCSVTFTPIEGSDYLVCECCGITARGELYNETPTCVFCDRKFIPFEMLL